MDETTETVNGIGLTAAQARELVVAYVYDNTAELAQIYNVVKFAAEKGLFNVEINKTFSKKTIQALFQAGYKVEDDNTRTIIDWSV